MGSQWVQSLVTMADAIVVTADEAHQQGADCRFCGSGGAKSHATDCPVTLASTVLRQARGAASGSGH